MEYFEAIKMASDAYWRLHKKDVILLPTYIYFKNVYSIELTAFPVVIKLTKIMCWSIVNRCLAMYENTHYCFISFRDLTSVRLGQSWVVSGETAWPARLLLYPPCCVLATGSDVSAVSGDVVEVTVYVDAALSVQWVICHIHKLFNFWFIICLFLVCLFMCLCCFCCFCFSFITAY